MAIPLLVLLLAAAPEGWGDEPAVIDGCRRVTEAELQGGQDLRGVQVYLDGKFGGAAGERLLLRASRVRLDAANASLDVSSFAALPRDTNIRVFGRATRDELGPRMAVDRIDRLADDTESYHRSRARVPDGDAAVLYALADRLQARFDRYGGPASGGLADWARQTRREAIDAERRTFEDQPAKLYDLAERARTLIGDKALEERIIDAALAAERKRLPAGQADLYFALADRWDHLLPGRAEPQALRTQGLAIEGQHLPPGDATSLYRLAERYERLGRDSTKARALTRRGLDLELAALGPLDYDGRYRLSAKVDKVLQDAGWSRRLLAEGAQSERNQLPGHAPVAYFQLAERYARDLGDPATRDALNREGLAVQERRLDPRDLNGHLELALAYLASLGDRAACIDRLRYCLTLVPDDERVGDKLAELGLVEVAGRWHERSAVTSDPRLTWQEGIEKAIAGGRIAVGMTPAQVRQAWGAPNRADAVYTRDGRTILWSYPGGAAAGGTRVTFRNGRVVAWSR